MSEHVHERGLKRGGRGVCIAAVVSALGALAGAHGGCGRGLHDDPGALCRGGAAEVSLHADGATTPMPVIGGLPLVEVMIDGRGPFTMVIDSGCEVVYVFSDAAREAGLMMTPRRVRFVTPGRADHTEDVATVEIGSLRIGECNYRHLHAIVRDVRGLSEFAGHRIDGMIGAALMRGQEWTLDYPAWKLSIRRRDREARDPAALVPMRAADQFGLLRSVDATIGGAAVALLVDTGSTDVLDLTLDAFDAVRAGGTGVESLGAAERSGFLGTERTERARIAGPVRIGPLELGAPTVVLTPTASRLGSGALGACRVTMDVERGRMWIEEVRTDP